jgi:gliding motility-associated-like protein
MKCLALLFFSFFASVSLCAQLCNGSLGDPVVHIDFGKGAGPGPALKPGVTTYSHVSVNCPNDGFYTLHNSIANCFSGTWHTIPEDHTPNDAGGFYMLVNASFVPGDFYLDTVRGLCTNTTYEFAAWVVNVLKPGGFCGNGIDPNLTFTIETTSGTILAKQNTGNMPESGTPVWAQYGVFFKTPINITDVVVRITNNAPGGCGNDLALDDITFRPCGPLVNAVVSSTGKDSAMLCEGDASSILLTANYPGGYASPAFQWQESLDMGRTWRNIQGAVSTSYTRVPTVGTGSYQYKLLIGESVNFGFVTCRAASNTVTIHINPLPLINIPSTSNACESTNFQLEATGGSAYLWNGPNNFTSTSSAIVFDPLKMTDAGKYSVVAISDKGCSNSGATTLTVFPSVQATVSNSSTICEGTVENLFATGGTEYLWSPSKGLSDPTVSNPQAQPLDSTLYQVKVSNQYGCYDSARVALNVLKKPRADAGPDKRTKSGIPIQLNGSASGHDVSWFWTPSNVADPSSLTTVANPSQTTTYTLHVVSGAGCGSSTDDVEVRVYEIPNAFSPNGDGINDNWTFKSPDAFSSAIIEVFNRYGQIVFRSNGYSKPWDGTYNGRQIPVGTYYYIIDLKSGTEPNITGWLLIVR